MRSLDESNNILSHTIQHSMIITFEYETYHQFNDYSFEYETYHQFNDYYL